ncbi:hypothetical protein Pcinc_023544 [Petrolisthes cinctipes]|uniref:Uncharacterized protein n=1 Tax=Petrolisthes cinctipes TaxID=88211 RepID=A0AAE1FD00_PETCI|nr:hypothetical protein Pcinc_023544 [Petrolisthes cinctipes]
MFLQKEIEEMLAGCFTEIIRLEQGPTIGEKLSLVKEYSISRKTVFLTSSKTITHELNSFMKLHKLRLRKGTSMQVDRKKDNDFFIMNSFYDVIEKELQNLQLQDKPGHIYNLDETSFPLNSSKTHSKGYWTVNNLSHCQLWKTEYNCPSKHLCKWLCFASLHCFYLRENGRCSSGLEFQ